MFWLLTAALLAPALLFAAAPLWRRRRAAGGRLGLALPLAAVLALPPLAYVLYNRWGHIDEVGLGELYRRTVDNPGDPREAQRLVIALGEAVRRDQDRPWAWYFLGENLFGLGLAEEAEIAYGRAASLLEPAPEKAAVLGRLAMARYLNAGSRLSPEAMAAVDEARAINPREASVLQLLAADAEEREDMEAAVGYWRQLVQAAPGSALADELRRRIAAARAGAEAPAGPLVEVNVSLAEGLALDGGLRVFVAARDAAREGAPPLAAVDTRVSRLPATIRLDDSSAVGPFNLSSAATVYVSALVSRAGTATPRPGDYRAVSESIALDGRPAVVDLVIAEPVP